MEELLEMIGEGVTAMNLESASSKLGTIVMLAAYILMSIGLYTIADRRKIDHPGLAWVPVARLWLLGCISDQYRYVSLGQTCNRRKTMLTLAIITCSAGIIMIVALTIVAVAAIAASASFGSAVASAVILILLLGLLCLAWMGVFVALVVVYFISLADLFASCDPATKVLFTVLSVLSSGLCLFILPAVLVFANRNKEAGMPPRTT